MVKMVSLSNKAYEELKKIKNENESFSDVIIKLLNKNKNIDKFAGILSSENIYLDSVEKEIMIKRKNNYDRIE